MILQELMSVLSNGCACFTILPYCEEYKGGLEALKRQPWYREIKDRKVRNIVTIGGGPYAIETCIELEE